MNGRNTLDITDWGYYLLPRAHPDSPGCTGLEVVLRPEPTHLHYDPESLHLRLLEGDQVTETTLTPASPLVETARVCPGLVTLRDRMDKRVDFFSFGGSLAGQAGPDKVIYRLESPAPILECFNNSAALPDQLASEVGLMLSVFKARCGPDNEGFATRLARIEPLQLYIASLASILLRYQRTSALQRTYHDLYTALLREKTWLQQTGQWPAQPLTLGKLFEVDHREIK